METEFRTTSRDGLAKLVLKRCVYDCGRTHCGGVRSNDCVLYFSIDHIHSSQVSSNRRARRPG